MCACAQRRIAFSAAFSAVRKGDAAAVKASAGFIASSAVTDIKAAALRVRNAGVAAAKNRLSR